MIHKVLALSFISFSLMISLYETLSIILLSKGTNEFLIFLGRTGVVVVRVFLFFTSAAFTGFFTRKLIESLNLEDPVFFNMSMSSIFLASLYIIFVHSKFAAGNMGAYSYLALVRKKVELPCPIPLNPSFLNNLNDETIDKLNIKKLVKVDLPKIPDMDKKKLEGLGLKGASPKQIQTVSQMDKKELEKKLKEEKEKRGVDKNKLEEEKKKRTRSKKNT